ncbi:MAG TPA: response regulator, partial [Verrucomicrobiae bacterium]|nr:response regulator [Verrucomicrobiae bacterium]
SLAQVSVPRPDSQISNGTLQIILLTLAGILLGFMLFRKAIPVFFDFLAPKLELLGYRQSPTLDAWPEKLAEDEEISKFLVGFRTGPTFLTPTPAAPAGNSSISRVPQLPPEEVKDDKREDRNLLKEFFAWAPGHIIEAGYLIKRIGRATGGPEGKAAARDKLNDLSVLIRSLQIKASLPELVPVWQLASALEGLLKQLTERVDTITPSTLRTISGGIDLLGQLCVFELRADLATNPAIRILVVDDDAVSRFAMGAAVKKVFNQPDFAENGDAALDLASKQVYDIVFLDVRMPGVDGFEVCSRIRAQELNRSTPVVFVTSLKDFDSQTTTVVSGGSDIVAKPFLTFEIVVKALTLVLQARLKLRDRMVEESNAAASSEQLPASPQNQDGGTVAEAAVSSAGGAAEPEAQPLPEGASMPSALSGEVLAGVMASFAEMRNELRLVGQTVDENERREKLTALHLCLQKVTRQIDVPELRPAMQLCSSLQGLLKKLQEKPVNAGASTLGTATAAVEVLEDLCTKGARPDLAVTPAISILVVDDEPLTRRAITGALQTAFLKPDSVENGEAALALARERTFDVIFLDVQMPGMDGYQVCKKIHEAGPNRSTPVIFVTSHKDFKARAESASSGGSDFVVKPFLFVEITVKALTFALRNRLQKSGVIATVRQSEVPKNLN